MTLKDVPLIRAPKTARSVLWFTKEKFFIEIEGRRRQRAWKWTLLQSAQLALFLAIITLEFSLNCA